jgi:hypothetical protein
LRSAPRFAALALGLVTAAPVGWGAEAKLAWSQADVVALTHQLYEALGDLLTDPGLRAEQASAYQQRQHEAAITTVKELQPRVAELRKRVAAGYDLEESRPFFERVAELRGEIAAYAGQSWLPEPTRKRAAVVRSLLEELSRYYKEQ